MKSNQVKKIVLNEEELLDLLREFFADISSPLMIGLRGALGAGKTTAVRLLAQILQSPDWVNSPSYILSQSYSTPHEFTLEHWDLYRLNGELPIELEQELEQSDCVFLVEWIDRFPALVERSDILVDLKIISEQAREVTISSDLELRRTSFNFSDDSFKDKSQSDK